MRFMDQGGRIVQLMKAPGDTGTKMRRKIASNSKAMENLQAVLALEVEGDSRVLELQTHVLEFLTELCADESTCILKETRVSFINRALDIFLTDKWM
jgi:hypothetical protein